MAITALEFMVLCSFREHGILPLNPSVLELGESNWYGDVSTEQLREEIARLSRDSGSYLEKLNEIIEAKRSNLLYEIVRSFSLRSLVESTRRSIRERRAVNFNLI